MKKIIDISWPLTNGMQEYKDRKSVKLEQINTIETKGSRDFLLCMNNHTGTHVDGPSHMLPMGKNLSELGLEKLIGPAVVIDCTSSLEKVTVDVLKGIPLIPEIIVLLQTKNSFRSASEHFDTNFIYLDTVAAEYLVAQKVKAVGIDYLGIERNQPDHQTHKVLLQHDIPIIEGLRLAHVQAGNYMFFCLPLLLENVDSAPARAVLQEV